MIRFEEPLWLLLALPWVAFWWAFARIQRRACAWVWGHVAERFHHHFTLLTSRGLRWQLRLLLALGLVLVVAAARPTGAGAGRMRELSGRVVLVLDASASMRATDVGGSGSDDPSESRFELARQLARELTRRLEGYRFALVTFSGAATLQLPMTADRASLEEALRVVETHNFYRSTGSNLASALDRILHFVEPERGDLQAVILSDGEPPFPDDYTEPLTALDHRGVAVHAVAVGSTEGQTRVIYDLRDILAKVEEPTVLREFTTRRVDRHLRRIARATGGFFEVAEPGVVEALAAAISERQTQAERFGEGGRRELSPELLGLVLLILLLDALVLGRRPASAGGAPEAFDLQRIRRRGRGVAMLSSLALLWLVLPAGCGGGGPWQRAARENERGIGADALGLWPAARSHYERSVAYDVLPEIPTYNLGRSLTLQGDYSEAHGLYQRALALQPAMAEAHDNDGHALYLWGEAERDPQGCRLDRTLDLWTAARQRFVTAIELYPPGSPGGEEAAQNLRFVGERIAEIEHLLAEPPPECAGASAGGGGDGEEQTPGSAGGGRASEEGGGAGAGGGQSEGGPGGGVGSGGMAGSSGAGGTGPLTPQELEQIAQALERLQQGRLQEGKYHRHTRAEQYPADSWNHPDPKIWW